MVDPSAVAPSASAAGLVAAQSKGFTAIRRPRPGVYCLTPAAGIDPARDTAAVSAEIAHSVTGIVPLPALNARSGDCAPAEFDVQTFNAAAVGSGPVSGGAFTIVVP